MGHRRTAALAAATGLLLPLAAAHAQAPTGHGDPRVRTEAHITQIKGELHITAAEAPQWDAFASVMRANAAELSDRLQQRQDAFGKMNAVDDLKSYADISMLHAQEAAKLLAPFQTLYAALSPEQQQAADKLFHKGAERRAAAHGGG